MAFPSSGTAMTSIGFKMPETCLRTEIESHFGSTPSQTVGQTARCKRVISATSSRERVPRISTRFVKEERNAANPPMTESKITPTTAIFLVPFIAGEKRLRRLRTPEHVREIHAGCRQRDAS